ncbi:MAG: hypothetical protein AUJ72_03405 [Candidatus Omnitrophica bacterium CG1_02_46_14]|nr:MAG: hypothetical protein AUJ72_03405 [Candidatus Omnitrophica bacterium CG1_02_46_14]
MEEGRKACEQLKYAYACNRLGEFKLDRSVDDGLRDAVNEVMYLLAKLPYHQSIKALIAGALPNLFIW